MKNRLLLLGLSMCLVACGGNQEATTLPITGTTTLPSTTQTTTLIEEPVSKDIKIVVLAGQSNAAGYTHSEYLKNTMGEDVYNTYKEGFESVKINYNIDYNKNGSNNKFVNVKLGQGCAKDRFGPEIGMAEVFSTYLEENIYIIKYAVGGTTLHTDWASVSSGNEGACTKGLYNHLDAALNKLVEEGYTPSIGALCWMQGESDAYSFYEPHYKSRLENFVKDFRNKYNSYALDEEINFVDAAINYHNTFVEYQKINKTKEEFANTSDYNFFIDTLSLELEFDKEPYNNVDIYHYDSASMVELGKAFGMKLLENACI